MSIRIVAIAVAAASVFNANAKTVAWWHFNEKASGQSTVNGEATILNAVDSTKLALKAGVLNNKGEYVSGKDEYLPVYTNAFPDHASWCSSDGEMGSDCRGMYFSPEKEDGSTDHGSVLYTEVTDDLKLPTLTVELFIKSDYGSIKNHWKNLIVMGGKGNQDVWALRIGQNGNLQFRSTYEYAINNEGKWAHQANSADGQGSHYKALDGKWHHVAFTFDGASKTVKLYFDYEQVASKSFDQGLVYVDDRRLEIGSFNKADYGRWRGWVDEVRISDEVLNPSDFLRMGWMESNALGDDDTAFYASFDGPFAAPYNPHLVNEAEGSEAYPARVAVSNTGKNPEFCTEGKLSDNVHPGISALKDRTNAGYWNFATNAAGMSAIIEIDDIRKLEDGTLVHDFTSRSCTIEMFVKPESSYSHNIYLACQHATGGGSGSLMWQLCKNRTIKFTMLPEGGGVKPSFDTDALSSDVWHHIALVLDRESRTAEVFVDYALAGIINDVLIDSTVDSTRYSKYLQLFGGYGDSHAEQMQGRVDEVRLTKRALKPHEFLYKGTYDPNPVGRTRAWISFDGDYTVKPRINEIPEGVASEVAAFDFAVPGVVIEDCGSNVLMETNKASFRMPGAVSFKRNMFADSVDMRSQTLEFFIWLDSSPAEDYINVFRFNDALSSDVVYGVRIFKDGSFNIRVDTVSASEQETVKDHFNQGKGFGSGGAISTDGKWHHIAFTFEPNEAGNTVLKMYKDYEYVGSSTANGILRTVGGGELSSTSFTVGSTALSGKIDEIRLSQGVLDVKDMLRATRVKLPFAVIIR